MIDEKLYKRCSRINMMIAFGMNVIFMIFANVIYSHSVFPPYNFETSTLYLDEHLMLDDTLFISIGISFLMFLYFGCTNFPIDILKGEAKKTQKHQIGQQLKQFQ